MIYVQHLLGIGHLHRAVSLGNALASRGMKVDLVSGGMPVKLKLHPDIRFHQLTPARCLDGNFSVLIDDHDQTVDDQWWQKRTNQLLDIFNTLSPRILITESFPFARRVMRQELLPLLEAAKQSMHPPIVVSSIRDILQPKNKPGREQQILDLINKYYDKVLVHGDAHFAKLEDTFSLAKSITDKTFYSGYISNHAAGKTCDPETGSTRKGVIVSGGGGAVSFALLQCAINAKPLSGLADQQWRLLAGPNLSQKDFDRLLEAAPENLIVERNRSDFQDLLKHCAVSVSQAGYNTTIDVLNAGAPAVMVPFSESGEIEQTLRAQLLQQRNRVIMLPATEMSASSLAAAIDHAAALGTPPSDIKTNGAEVSADLLIEWLIEKDRADGTA